MTIDDFIRFLKRYKKNREITITIPGMPKGIKSFKELKGILSNHSEYNFYIHMFRIRKPGASISQKNSNKLLITKAQVDYLHNQDIKPSILNE